MSRIDIENLPLAELKRLRTEIARAIARHETQRKRDAVVELERTARALGFTLAELAGMMPRGQSGVQSRYANPFNSSEVWCGRGRKPRWFEEAMAAGKKPEDLRI